MSRIHLGLDLGSLTGFALARNGEHLESGVQRFDLARGESPGMRFLRFRGWLEKVLEWGPEAVFYERAHHRGGHATELLVGFQTRVQEACAERGIPYSGVPTGTLKLFATGKGNASKEAMIEAARERWGVEPEDDNHADALLALAWGLKEVGG